MLAVIANGRLDRAILCLQRRELLGLSEDPVLDQEGRMYQAPLQAYPDAFDGLEYLSFEAVDWVR
jgi:hypothetical protein